MSESDCGVFPSDYGNLLQSSSYPPSPNIYTSKSIITHRCAEHCSKRQTFVKTNMTDGLHDIMPQLHPSLVILWLQLSEIFEGNGALTCLAYIGTSFWIFLVSFWAVHLLIWHWSTILLEYLSFIFLERGCSFRLYLQLHCTFVLPIFIKPCYYIYVSFIIYTFLLYTPFTHCV